jgi:hypothetical protein
MSEAVTFEVTLPDEPPPANDKFRREQWAFYCMLGDLLKTHRGQHVAVHDKRVIATGADPLEVTRQAYALVGNVPLCVGHVTDEPPPVVRLPRYRLVRG